MTTYRDEWGNHLGGVRLADQGAGARHRVGPWWRAATVEEDRARPPKAHETCPTHPGGWKHNCACCAADRLAADDEQPINPTDRHTSIAAARAALRTGASE